MKKYILFDLDGTLTDSGEGILNSVLYALEKYDIKADKKDVTSFIGPPLRDEFTKVFGFSKEQSEEAVKFFRERYFKIGVFENRPYDNIEDVLKALKEKGLVLAVATSKPQVLADKVLNHFNLHKYFDLVLGADLEGKFEKKSDVIKEVLKRLNAPKEDAIMVGDTKYDISGAKENGIESIGVLYGYGENDELKDATYIAETVDALKKMFQA